MVADGDKLLSFQYVDFTSFFNSIFGFVCFSFLPFDLDGHNLGTAKYNLHA